MKLKFQIYLREYEVTRGKHQQQHVMMKETPANLIFHCRHYVNIRVLLQINAQKQCKHTENVINALLNLKTSAILLLRWICQFYNPSKCTKVWYSSSIKQIKNQILANVSGNSLLSENSVTNKRKTSTAFRLSTCF